MLIDRANLLFKESASSISLSQIACISIKSVVNSSILKKAPPNLHLHFHCSYISSLLPLLQNSLKEMSELKASPYNLLETHWRQALLSPLQRNCFNKVTNNLHIVNPKVHCQKSFYLTHCQHLTGNYSLLVTISSFIFQDITAPLCDYTFSVSLDGSSSQLNIGISSVVEPLLYPHLLPQKSHLISRL